MKLRITYEPKDTDPQSWDFDPEDADNLEAEALEIVGDEMWDSYGQWILLMGRGNIRAIRALLWVLHRRNDPEVDFNVIRFRTTDVSVDWLDRPEPEGKGEAGDSDTGLPPPNTDSAA